MTVQGKGYFGRFFNVSSISTFQSPAAMKMVSCYVIRYAQRGDAGKDGITWP